jgi:NAD(P)-dependent dehydrogenase (short-subunit alcohol dehydrogenase family)
MAKVTPAQSLFDLTGEVALVTGASSGLGARFAEVLAAHGAKVVLAARRLDRISDMAARLGNATAVALDVTRPETFEAAFTAVGPVSLLVNNAGVANAERFVDTTPETFRKVQETNVDSVWHLSQAFARRLIAEKRQGTIVNIASIAAFVVNETPAAYAVSKAAVQHMTRAMALELARYRIRVNAIAPGFIYSEMTTDYLTSEAGKASIKRIPQRRAGDPSDLDGTLLLLASTRASGFMTGSTVVVDGGDMLA